MDSETIAVIALGGGIFLLMLASALARVVWPDWSVSRWLNERGAHTALSSRHRDGGDGGGWFDGDCGGDGGGGD